MQKLGVTYGCCAYRHTPYPPTDGLDKNNPQYFQEFYGLPPHKSFERLFRTLDLHAQILEDFFQTQYTRAQNLVEELKTLRDLAQGLRYAPPLSSIHNHPASPSKLLMVTPSQRYVH